MANGSFDPLTTAQVKPGQIPSPIPGQQQAIDTVDEFAEFTQPLQAAPAPVQEQAPSQGEFDQFSPTEGTLPTLGGEQVQVEDTAAGELGSPLQSLQAQAEDFTTRVATSIAGTPEAQKLTLENRLGPKNVKQLKDGSFLIRKEGEKKFRKLDPDTFEFLNDIFADEFKTILQGSGGTIGAGLAAPTIGGTAVGAGIGASIGGQVANAIGSLIGVVRPEGAGGQAAQATEAAETGLTFATGEAALGRLGKFFKDRSAARALSKNRNISNEEILDQSSKQALETLEEMNQSGFKVKLPEGSVPGVSGEISLPANSLIPHTPGVQATAKSLENEKAFQLVKKEAAEQYSNFVLQHVETAAGTGKGKLAEAVKTGLRDSDNTLANNIKGVLSQARAREGKVIGDFRKQVKGTAGKQPLPSEQTQQAMASIAEDLGIRGTVGQQGKLGLQFPGDDQLIADLGFRSKAQLNTFKSQMNDIAEKLTKQGGLNIDDLLRLSKTVGNQAASAKGFSKSVLGRLSSALRADTREGMATILEPAAAAEYNAAIGTFRKLAKNADDLKTIFKDDVGANTFVSGLLSKSKKSPEALKALKELVLKEDPKLWNNMVGEFLEEAAVLSRDTSPGKLSQFNAKTFEKKVFGIGKENLETLMGTDSGFSSKQLKKMLELGKRMDGLLDAGAPDTVVANNAKNAIQAFAAFSRVAKINASAMFLRMFDKNARLAKMVTKRGVEDFLEKVPQAEKGRMRILFNKILAAGQRSGAIETVKRTAAAGALEGTLEP